MVNTNFSQILKYQFLSTMIPLSPKHSQHVFSTKACMDVYVLMTLCQLGKKGRHEQDELFSLPKSDTSQGFLFSAPNTVNMIWLKTKYTKFVKIASTCLSPRHLQSNLHLKFFSNAS